MKMNLSSSTNCLFKQPKSRVWLRNEDIKSTQCWLRKVENLILYERIFYTRINQNNQLWRKYLTPSELIFYKKIYNIYLSINGEYLKRNQCKDEEGGQILSPHHNEHEITEDPSYLWVISANRQNDANQEPEKFLYYCSQSITSSQISDGKQGIL